jgi:hypothetical protein
MDVRLEAIELNHDPTGASVDALTIRRNGSQPVAVPEWRHGVSTQPEDSPAAYAIADTHGRTLTIRVQLRRMDSAIAAVEVRAIDGNAAGGCLYAILQALGITPTVRPGPANVLGEVRPRSVTFRSDDLTDFEIFELTGVRLAQSGVGVSVTNWRWQARSAPYEPWTDIGTSSHEIFVLLRTPTSPWQQAPSSPANTQLPWTEVLRHACTWAEGASDADEVAERVTRAVYDLGPATIEYDCPGGGSTRYSFPSFNATAFLERLAGGTGNGKYVNCTDCATIVSTFANALGCDLWQSRMGSFFQLNPLLAIGSGTWQTACNWGAFAYHEVAWKGACTSAENVYDACLQVDGDSNPTAAPHVALLPVDLRFGEPGDGVYRDRLATPAGRPACAPQPATRQRRAII